MVGSGANGARAWKRIPAVAIITLVVVVGPGAGTSQAAPSNGWYGFIHTEASFDRTQWGSIARPNHLVQTDTATTVFRGNLDQLIFGVFDSAMTNSITFTCGMSGIYSEFWSGAIPRSDGHTPTSAAGALTVPGGVAPTPGVPGNYRLQQGNFSPVPFTGTFTSFHTHNDTCTPMFFPAATSGNATIGGGTIINQGDSGDNVSSIPAPAGWRTLSGSKALTTVFESPGVDGTNRTVRTTTWTWGLTREPDLDYDGMPDSEDNCPPEEVGDPDTFNPDQEDADGDEIGDACDVSKIIVVKQTMPSGSDAEFEFTGALGGNIGDGGTLSTEVEPGTHPVTELAKDGWLLSSIVCSDADSTGTGSTATFIVDEGEQVTCTFTNTRRGTVTLKKTTNGVVDPGKDIAFVLTGPGLPSGGITRSTFGDQDGVLEFGSTNLVPGQTYKICESPVPAGFTSFWKLDGVIVTPFNPDASRVPPEDLGTRCYSFQVAPGQTRAFLVDNSRPGGDPRTIGYWKNWNRCTGGNQSATAAKNGGAAAGFFLVEDLLPQLVGDFSVTTCQKAVKLLAKQDQSGRNKSSDAAYELGAQFLASRFNLAAGAEVCSAIQQAVVDAQSLLDTIAFTGSGDYLGSKSKSTWRTQALSLASTIDRYNNGNLC